MVLLILAQIDSHQKVFVTDLVNEFRWCITFNFNDIEHKLEPNAFEAGNVLKWVRLVQLRLHESHYL